MDEALSGSEKATSSTSGPVTRPSRRARNDQKWDSLQDEIRHIYMTDDFTLQNTKRVIEEKHGFKASERKWKEKLKEWKFDKNISATDMSVLATKAGKRMRDEGKRTVFFLGESQITRERIEQFKRRKLIREIDDVSAEAETPKNITYHTPPRDSPEPERNNSTVSKRDGGFPSWYPYPGNRTSSDFKTSEGKDRLSTVLELPSESESSEDGFSILETHQTYDSSEMDEWDDSALSQNSATINEPDRLLGHELAAQMDRVISRMIESSSLRAKHPGAVSSLSSSHVQRPSDGLDYLSTGVPKGLPLHMTVSNTRGLHARNSQPLEESEIETPHYFVEKELDHPFLADMVLPVLGTNDSNESEGSVSESESSTISERGMQALSARSRLYFHQKQKALELRANGRSMAGIFEHLVADSDETGLEFCQNMWKLCSFFEKAHLLKEALIGLELVQAGYDMEFGAASKETMRCFVRKARILRRMKEYRDSEALYRQAIAGFKALRQRLSQIKCQLILGNFLRVLGRDSEALRFLLEATIENFILAKTTEESRKVVELLESVQRLHHKMGIGPDFADSIFQLQTIQQQWVEVPHHLKLWTEFVRIGAHYSKLKKFELADLCFTIPVPIRSPNNPTTRVQLLKCCRELSMHYKRQGKLIQSIEQLENALQHFSALIHQKSFERTDFQRTLVMTEALEQELFAALGELLVVTEPSRVQPVVQESDKVSPLAMWKRAEAAWSKLDAHRHLFQHKLLRNSHIDNLRDRETMQRNDTASISSHGSSMFSSGSTSSRIGITYSVGSASSIVSNSAFMVPS